MVVDRGAKTERKGRWSWEVWLHVDVLRSMTLGLDLKLELLSEVLRHLWSWIRCAMCRGFRARAT
jgi:hypothetical protein